TDFSVNPTWINYDKYAVTLTGRLLSGTPGVDERPLAGVRVHGFSVAAEATTAADGSFTMKGNVGGSYVSALFDGDPTHRRVDSQQVTIEATPQPPPLFLSVPSSGAAGAKVTATGLLQRLRDAGTWVPLPNRQVVIAFYDRDNFRSGLPTANTDARG